MKEKSEEEDQLRRQLEEAMGEFERVRREMQAREEELERKNVEMTVRERERGGYIDKTMVCGVCVHYLKFV